MRDDEAVLVLTTREKEWWWSMQEVIPAIERVWTDIGRSGIACVQLLCVPLDADVEQSLRASASRLKHVVLAAVTPETVKVALLLRTHLNVGAPIIMYVFGDATEGFHAFGALPSFLNEGDTFIVSSEAEGRATRHSFPSARVAVIPIPLVDGFKVGRSGGAFGIASQRLMYVGRISEQKNLHALLLALWILRSWLRSDLDFHLGVCGSEDNLGSPNMGLKFPGYEAYLRELVSELGLTSSVSWHGFKPRDWLFEHVHQAPHVLVSPSLHSDENFGSSVLASLVNGHQVVATAWGGHLCFRPWFPGQLMLVPVRASSLGPVVSPVAIAEALREVVTSKAAPAMSKDGHAAALDRFSGHYAVRRAVEILDNNRDSACAPLRKSDLQEHLERQRALFGGMRKIYTGYDDPAARVFFDAYGMADALEFDDTAQHFVVPWVRLADGGLQLLDPHRGLRSWKFETATREASEVILLPSLERKELPRSVLARLARAGYVFPMPRTCR